MAENLGRNGTGSNGLTADAGKRAERVLPPEIRLLGDVTTYANCALLLVDRDNRLVYANRLAYSWFGGNGELLGRTCCDVLGWSSAEIPCIASSALLAGDVVRGDDFDLTVDGEERSFQPVATPVADAEGQVVQVALAIFDVSERKRAERWLRNALTDLRRRNNEVSVLLESSQSLLKVGDFRQTVRDIYENCKRLVGARAGYVLRCSDEAVITETLFLDAADFSCSVSIPVPQELRGLKREAHREGRTIYCNEYGYTSWARFLPPGHMQVDNVLYSPLVYDGKVFGLLGLANKPGGFDEDDRRLASVFTELMALALHNSDTMRLLEESEKRWRRLAENAPDVIFRYDLRPVRRFAYLSPALTKILGYPVERFYRDPHSIMDLVHPDDLVVFANRSPEDTTSLTYRVRHLDGHYVWMEQRRVPVLDDDGTVVAIEGVVRDVTEEKAADRALQESEERYRSVISVMEEGIILWDRDGRVAECNAGAERILGTPRDRLLGQGHNILGWQIFLEDGSPFPLDGHPFLISLKTGKGCSNVVMGLCKPPRGLVWLSVNSQPLLKDGETTPYAVVTSFTDITQRKGAEEQMSLLAKHVRLLLESTDVGLFGIDLTGRCTFLNSYGARQLGYRQDDVVGKDMHSLVHHSGPEGRECPRESCHILQVLQTGVGVRGSDQVFWRADGSSFPVDYSCYPIWDEGALTGAVITFTDITLRKRAEEAWRESRSQLAEAQHLAHLGSYRWNVRSGDLTCSDEALNILGLDSASMERPSQQWLEVVHPEDRQRVVDAIRRSIGEVRGFSYECRVMLADGRVKHLHVVGRPYVDSAGTVNSITGAVMDVTERKQLEERLLRAQRLETAGRIAGQVAHDFNNLLAPLALYPDLLKMQLPDGHAALKYCEGMVDVVQQMADINADLLTLGRRGHFEHQLVDVNRVVRQSMERLMGDPETLTVTQSLAADLPMVKGSSAQLLRVITNLVLNAREAMNDSGTLTVKTENVYIDEPLGHYDHVSVGQYVRLTVADTGHGIPPRIRDKIFDAFFTTKQADKKPGTGLGLSIVLAVVEDHGGYLDVESEMGVGTTFSVYLPVCTDVPRPIPSSTLRGGSERVLVVDDDRALREAVGELLRQLGYEVAAVSSGEAALAALSDHPADLLILDMIMPSGMDGTETYRRVREIRPNQKAIILSGFAESERVKEALDLGAGRFVRKPVTVEKLARAVREELDRH